MDKNISDFLADVCKHLESKELRDAVRSELAAHLLDKTEEYRLEGLTDEEAAEKALGEFGAPKEIGEKLAAAYKPDYKARVGGVLLLLTILLMFSMMNTVMILAFVDWPSLLFVTVTATAFVLIGGYKNATAESLLLRFSSMALLSGAAWSLAWFMNILVSLSDIEALGPNVACALLSLLYGTLLSIAARALIPSTITAKLRKTPVSEALSAE